MWAISPPLFWGSVLWDSAHWSCTDLGLLFQIRVTFLQDSSLIYTLPTWGICLCDHCHRCTDHHVQHNHYNFGCLPRAMSKSVQLLLNKKNKDYYLLWISILSIGTCLIFLFLLSEMGLLVQIATVLSFITAPIYAILNYRLITSKHTPKKSQSLAKDKNTEYTGRLFSC